VNRYEALKHAVKAHAGQVDKCGQPYILHPIAVAEALERRTHRESEIVVALLHDVWEDTDYLIPTADWEGEQDQWDALVAITRRVNEPYFQYINRVEGNYFAAHVKLADLWHNLSLQRQGCLPAAEVKSLEARYLKARDRIWEALGYEWWPEPLSSDEGGR